MAPLKITLDGVKIAVSAQPLHGDSFAPFGEVIQNPRPDVHPSQFDDAGPLPLHAVPANQGSAIKYQHVTKMVNRYGQAPSGKPGSAVMNMFVCAARKLQTQPSRSHGTVSSSRVFEVNILERHPYTSQTFSPLSTTGSRDTSSREGYLVIVAPSSERPLLPSSSPALGYVDLGHDKPDLTQLKAFIATTDQAVTYGAGTWHAPMVALGPEGSTVSFIVTQFTNGIGNEDCEEVVLESPNGDGHVLIELPQSSTSGASRRAQVKSLFRFPDDCLD